MPDFEKVKRYSSLVCEQIRMKQAHSIISEEIENHITDRAEVLTESGEDEECAIDRAIAEMGDPVVVGSQLDRTHKPKIDRSLPALTALALIMGAVIRVFVPITTSADVSPGKNLLIAAVGFACMLAAYMIDFTVIGRYPKLITGLLLAVSWLIILVSPSVNTLMFYLNVGTHSIRYLMLIFPVAFAGILFQMRNKGYKGILISIAVFFIPVFIGVITNNTSGSLYCFAACLILFSYVVFKGWFNVRKLYGICVAYLPMLLASSVLIYKFIYSSDYRLYRFKTLIDPMQEPYGYGYLNMVLRSSIRGSKFIGKGDYLQEGVQWLPSSRTDYLLTYLADRFGYISMFIIMGVMLAFVLRMVYMSRKQKSVLGKLVSLSIIIVFSMQIVFYFLSNLGFMLISTFPLPFIAYGGSATVINMLLIGIILSVFKTGYLVRDVQIPVK